MRQRRPARREEGPQNMAAPPTAQGLSERSPQQLGQHFASQLRLAERLESFGGDARDGDIGATHGLAALDGVLRQGQRWLERARLLGTKVGP